ncbi:hypothetical protein [Parvularcula lutaonensis]|uniref:Uncharacterized protein n=1 Tax=Parvularcula lutaonensis TaxID=491923 RepID=A0ABV7M9Q0_9PROT|nr:hypothetical protein [Parvularcula lutaonensis]GGY47694.1 hypothetical protein GCM10007148_16380 [Parvularcula lutaonensis]
MAETKSLSIGSGNVRAFATLLRAFHGKTAVTDQNDGSNESDTLQDDLELSKEPGELADLRGLYAEIGPAGRLDIAALLLLGMDEAADFDEAIAMAGDRDGPDLADMLEMPHAPDLILAGLERMGGKGDNVEAVRPLPESGSRT